MKKKSLLSFLLCAVLVLALFAGCGKSSSTSESSGATTDSSVTTEPEATEGSEAETPATRTITDMSGVEVEIPYEVNTYVDSWYAHNAVIVMLDQAEGLVSTACDPDSYAWMFLVCENMYNAEFATFSTEMNLEEIVGLKPDVVFGSNESYREMFENVGIPFINCNFKTYETMIQSIQMTAEVLGGDAIDIADEWVSYLNENIDWVAERVAVLDESEKKTILHGSSVYTLGVDGADTIIDQWIKASGGINAAADEITGNLNTATFEQFLAWDPDVIITGSTGEDVEIMNDSAWAALSAVQNGEVYCNPKGVFAWDRYGVEEALQMKWAASILYPDLFEDFDIREELKYFYETFFHYSLTDEQVELILAREDPE